MRKVRLEVTREVAGMPSGTVATRYANTEVSYLLQRMEAYHGVAILTTNCAGTTRSGVLTPRYYANPLF